MPLHLPLRSSALFLAFALLASLAAPLLRADTVVLKNGDRLTGTTVKLDSGKLTFKTAYAAEPIAIAWDQVTSLTTAQPMILLTAKATLTITSIERSDSGLIVATSTGPATLDPAAVAILRTPADQKSYEDSLDPGWGHAWAGAATVSLALARGNSETATFGAGFTAARTTRTDKTSLYANTLYSTNANAVPSTSANTTNGGLRYDHNLNPKLLHSAQGTSQPTRYRTSTCGRLSGAASDGTSASLQGRPSMFLAARYGHMKPIRPAPPTASLLST